jgi:hypothetical protein
LITDGLSKKLYNPKKYEEQMFYFNTEVRPYNQDALLEQRIYEMYVDSDFNKTGFTTKEIKESVDILLCKNYIRKDSQEFETYKFEIIQEYCRVKFDKFYVRRLNYEFKNILERFMLALANKAPEGQVYVDLELDDPIYELMRKEMKDKKVLNKFQIEEYVTFIHQTIRNFLQNPKKIPTVNKDIQITGNSYQYKRFKFYVNSIRNNVLRKYPEENVLRILIRYGLMFLRGQQWNLPGAWYRRVVQVFDADIEGFASPLNSQLMLIRRDAKFCSLFKDTDACFGSIGSIFDLDAKDVEGKTMINNPPYVEKIMDDLMKLQTNWMEQVPVRIIMVVPNWEDAEYFQLAMESPYLKYEELLKAKEHFYETNKKGNIEKIVATFPSHIFVFSSFEDESKEIEDMYKTVAEEWKIK